MMGSVKASEMATHSKYANLMDEELLREVDDARARSPVIEELAKRLEKGTGIGTDSNHRVECPVCEAALEADFCEGNNMFTLELGRE